MAVHQKHRSEDSEEGRMQAVSPHQVNVICMDDDEFSTVRLYLHAFLQIYLLPTPLPD